MEKIKQFVEKLLVKEAECWTRLDLNNLEDFNQSVRELHSMAIERVGKGLGIYEMTDFGIFERTEKERTENPLIYKPRHLYKLSAYKNKIYGDIWVAYVSIKNPIGEPYKGLLSDGFIIGEIENNLKIIGTMGVKLNSSTMKAMGWKGSIYNPSDLDIKKLGKFLGTERYFEPSNRDDFSLDEYLKDN